MSISTGSFATRSNQYFATMPARKAVPQPTMVSLGRVRQSKGIGGSATVRLSGLT